MIDLKKIFRLSLVCLWFFQILVSSGFTLENVKVNLTKEKIKSNNLVEDQMVVAINENEKLKAKWSSFPIKIKSINANHIKEGSIEINDLADGSMDQFNFQLTTEKFADGGVISDDFASSFNGNKIEDKSIYLLTFTAGMFPAYTVSENTNYYTISSFLYFDTIDNYGEWFSSRYYFQPGTYSFGVPYEFDYGIIQTIWQGAGDTSIIHLKGYWILEDNTQLKDLKIIFDEDVASLVISGKNVSILNCTISGGGNPIIIDQGSENILIKGNRIIRNSSYKYENELYGYYWSYGYKAITAGYGKNIIIEDNYISFPTDNTVTNYAIQVYGYIDWSEIIPDDDTYYEGKQLIIRNNIIEYDQAYGIYMASGTSSHSIISGNILEGSGTAIYTEFKDTIIVDNLLMNTSAPSIEVVEPAHQLIIASNIGGSSIRTTNTTDSEHLVQVNIMDSISISGSDSTTQPGNTQTGGTIDDLDELNTIY